MFAEGLKGILRARRSKSASRMPLERRDADLIKLDQQDKRKAQCFLEDLKKLLHASVLFGKPGQDFSHLCTDDGVVKKLLAGVRKKDVDATLLRKQ